MSLTYRRSLQTRCRNTTKQSTKTFKQNYRRLSYKGRRSHYKKKRLRCTMRRHYRKRNSGASITRKKIFRGGTLSIKEEAARFTTNVVARGSLPYRLVETLKYLFQNEWNICHQQKYFFAQSL